MENRVIISAEKQVLNIKDLLHYKDLFWVLAYRDFKVRYAQTALGMVWAFIQPIITLVIYALVFGKAVQVDTGGVPYTVFAMAGLSAWTYFAYVFNNAGSSLVGSQALVTKVYFPRLVIPLSKAMVGIIDFGITLLLLFVTMLFTGYFPGTNLIYLPLFMLLLVITAVGAGIWVSALTIRFRDLQVALPFFVQIGAYATPVGYPSSMIPDQYQLLYHLNPMAGIVEGFRWVLAGGDALTPYAYVSFAVGVFLFLTSIFYFSKVEHVMADII